MGGNTAPRPAAETGRKWQPIGRGLASRRAIDGRANRDWRGEDPCRIVNGGETRGSTSCMRKPDELASDQPYGPWSCRGCDVWDAICAAASGDVARLRDLLEREPNLYRAGYWYTQPIYYAVREGHPEAVQVLLDAGADPAEVGMRGEDLVTVARDRGHEAVARLLEDAIARGERLRPAPVDHPIHEAAEAGDLGRVRELLDAEPELVHRTDRAGGTPLHRAVAASRARCHRAVARSGRRYPRRARRGPRVRERLCRRGLPADRPGPLDRTVLGPARGHGDCEVLARSRRGVRPDDRGRARRPREGSKPPRRRSRADLPDAAQRQAQPLGGGGIRPSGHRATAAGAWRRPELAGRALCVRGERPCTPRHAPGTGPSWSFSSRTGPIPTAGSTRRAAPPMPPRRPSSVPC